MFAPPYQLSPGGASTTDAAHSVYWARNYCSVLYKEKAAFNLAVHFQTQRCMARSDPSAELQNSALQSDI